MNSISNAIKCKNCFRILKNPILLPCKHSICKHHVNDEKLMNQGSDSISCKICEVRHKIPQDGFLDNQALSEIVDAHIEHLSLGPVHEDSKQSCSELESLLIDLDALLSDPGHFTSDEIRKLKNGVEIKSEQLKLKIDEETEKLIKKLDRYQERCDLFLSKDEYVEELNRLHEEKKMHGEKLNSWQTSLDKLKFDEDEWKRIKQECVADKECLSKSSSEFKNSLLLKDFDMHQRLVDFFEKINIHPLFDYIKLDSVIIGSDKKEEFLELCGFNFEAKWTLLYRASAHGFQGSQFHAHCDQSNKTLTVIKTTNGYIFGGFTNVLWKDQYQSYGIHQGYNKHRQDNNSFILSFKNPQNSPLKIPVSQAAQAILCDYNSGPCFGNYDIYICNNSNSNIGSYSNLGCSYVHPDYDPGTIESKNFLAGSYNFQVAEIEVFVRA